MVAQLAVAAGADRRAAKAGGESKAAHHACPRGSARLPQGSEAGSESPFAKTSGAVSRRAAGGRAQDGGRQPDIGGLQILWRGSMGRLRLSRVFPSVPTWTNNRNLQTHRGFCPQDEPPNG